MEANGVSESKNLRVQFTLAICLGGLYILTLYALGYSHALALYSGLVFSAEIFLGLRMMTTVFRYFQPKQTFSFVPIVTLLLLTALVAFLFFLIIRNVELNWRPELHLPNFYVHFVFLFFIFWVGFYEWWFSKNEVRNANDTNRLLHLQEDLKNAEIKNIQQNIQPHFLFNSLNSISALTLTEPEEAQKMVVKLSDFLRHSVLKNQQMFVPLKVELEQIKRYLDIEQIRFSHRLVFNLIHLKENDVLEIPAMLLQPLIENAIKFGLYGQTGLAEINMECKVEGTYLVVVLENPVDNEHIVKTGTGFGLSSIRKKLYLLFAENNLLATEHVGQKFRTELKIPLRHEGSIG